MSENKGATRVNNMVNVLRDWQAIERESMNVTAEIMEQTRNPLVRLIMEIIRHDSLMHHRVQSFLLDALEYEDVAVTREDVAEIWNKIEAHDQAERKTIEMARTLRDEAWNPVHRQVLNYLLTDEQKHDSLIGELREITKGMSKASGG